MTENQRAVSTDTSEEMWKHYTYINTKTGCKCVLHGRGELGSDWKKVPYAEA